MTDLDREAVVQTFVAEGTELLSSMEETLVVLETRPADQELLHSIFRAAHNFKGAASSLGYCRLEELAHALEDVLDQLVRQLLSVTSRLITLLLGAVDALKHQLGEATSGRDEFEPPARAMLERLHRASRLEPEVLAEEPEPPPPTSKKPEQTVAWDTRGRTLRVAIGRLDRMLDLAGEISISRGRVRQLIEKLGGRAAAEVLEAYSESDHLYLDLQEQLMKIRMVPVGPIFRQLVRAVRDIAAAHGKVARLVVEGREVEVDTTVIEQIRDPLSHLIRNAIGHGIESPEMRRSKGKDPCGLITLRARHASGSIAMQLSDDGAGLSRERIAARAREMGLVQNPEKLPDQELFQLVFEPGFSTAEEVTDLSGRGFGLDVVRRNIEALRGTVSIEGHPGLGTTVDLRLPLTLAIIEGFSVAVGDDVYVVPMEAVVECLDLPSAESGPNPSGVLNLRGEPLPYVRLRELFGVGGHLGRRESVLVVQHEGGRAGLAVDGLLGEGQTVIKPLRRAFQLHPCISGAAILGSGRVALIIDIPALLRELVQARPTPAEPSAEQLSST